MATSVLPHKPFLMLPQLARRRFHSSARSRGSQVSYSTSAATVATYRHNRWRSVLFSPHKPSAMQKAMLSGADAVCFDLEDGACPDKKDEARSSIREFLEKMMADPHKHNPLSTRVLLRVNALEDLDELKADIDMLSLPIVHSVFLPKVESTKDVLEFQKLFDSGSGRGGSDRAHPLQFIPILEMPGSFCNAYEIAGATPRNSALVFGHADFLLHTHGKEVPEALEWPRNMLVLAARARGLVPLDCAHTDLTDHIGYEMECKRARNLGFSGKVALHPNQVQTANFAFAPTRSEIEWAKQLIGTSASSKNIFVSDQGKMGGPPYVKRARKMLADVGQLFDKPATDTGLIPPQPDSSVAAGVSPKAFMPTYGLNLSSLFPGKRVLSVLDLTVTEAVSAQWDQSFFNANRLSCSAVVAQRFGLQGQLLPFSLMLVLTVGLSVIKFSEKAVVYLGMRRAQYLSPCYPNDTVRSEMLILSYRNTSDGRASVINSLHTLFNQHGNAVFRAFKATMFDPIPGLAPGEAVGTEFEKEVEAKISETATLRSFLLGNTRSDVVGDLQSEFPLVPGEVIVHRIVKVFGESEHRALVTMLRVTNQHHYNSQMFKPHELLIAGPLTVSAALGNSSHDLGHIIDEQFIYTSNTNKVNHGDVIGSLSYVVSVTPIADMLEEAVILTIGVKNVDMEELVKQPLPTQLFADPAVMKAPKQYEEICVKHFPLLFRKIVCQSLRKIVRPRAAEVAVRDCAVNQELKAELRPTEGLATVSSLRLQDA